jgi:hypothetical protein
MGIHYGSMKPDVTITVPSEYVFSDSFEEMIDYHFPQPGLKFVKNVSLTSVNQKESSINLKQGDSDKSLPFDYLLVNPPRNVPMLF